ncbi:MAG: GNAT family N-acetyltransferase [Flavobacteriaceae bacterium]
MKSFAGSDIPPVIPAGDLYLRTPEINDFVEWAQLRQCSRRFLTPWEPVWPRDDLTKPAFRRRIRRYLQDLRDDIAYPFFICRAADDAILGGLTLGNVRRGVTQACTVGYWVGAPYAARGVMSRALSGALGFAFDHLRLNRVEAACMPANLASIRVLQKVGFAREGLARRYLCIDGVWEDHLLFAILQNDPRPGVAEPLFPESDGHL